MSLTHPHPTRRYRRPVAVGVAATLAASLAVALPAITETAQAAPGPAATLTVEADQPFREATVMASGSLYGIANDGVPSDALIAPLKPDTFVQMPPGGTQQPTGDTLNVWQAADRAGAGVVVRLVDYYPGWPYQFSWTDTQTRLGWENAVRDIVNKIETAGVTNVVAYAPWNEPDITWRDQNGSFLDFWEFSYNLLREIAPDVPIQGPNYSTDISDMREFLEFAKETNTVPDVLEWHELIRPDLIPTHVNTVNALLEELELGDIPVDITEYATTAEVGIPGKLVPYLAKLERYGIDRAELPFWNQSGTLGDLLVSRGGAPNGAYWMYTWYAQFEGDMVTTTPPSNTSPLEGLASVNDAKDTVRIIAGGNTGATSVVVNGLDQLNLGDNVNVKLEYTPAYGRTTPTAGPITISNTTYEVGENGSITVPIVMNPAYGYHVVITEAGDGETIDGSYVITNGNSGLALEPSAGTDGATVVQSTADGSAEQVWDVTHAGSGLYKIVNKASGLALGVQGGSTTNGALAVVAASGAAENQLWQPVPNSVGNIRFTNYGTGLTLGVQDKSTADGASVIQWADGVQSTGCLPTTSRQPGKFNTALDLCGTSGYGQLPTGIVSGLTGDWSISTWVKPKTVATWSRVFDFGTGQSANMFLTVSAGNGPRFAITSGGAGSEKQLNWTGQNLPLDQWSNVTIVSSGTTGTMYVNGNAVSTNTAFTTKPSALGQTNRNYIGKSQYNDPAYNGAVDDLAIYDRALSAQEVAALASGQVGAGNVANYKFDETSNFTTLIDSSGNNRNGTVVAGTGSSGTATTATDAQTPDRFWTLTEVEEPEPGDITVDRVAGANRYEVAVNISEGAYPETAPVVYVASGENYPDALSAGPAAAFEGGPLLLVKPGELPASVSAEIARLQPSKIVVVGGILSVTEGVYNDLAALTDETVRIAGANRYEVSRNVAEYAFGSADVPLVYVATGEKFPDALSAGGAAGSKDAPVVLVRGSASDLDADTAALLDSLGTTDTRVLGGEASVTPGVFEDIAAISTAVRLGGSDRYQAARAVNSDAFESADRAFIATGLNFPDALAGSAWAAAAAAPMYVAPGTCVTAGVLADLETLGVTHVTLLGGEASLTPAVFNLTACS
ncbi:putative cell wall-binding protein [Microbacteriaceae bacterium SG_E_30_P1]|uniref:Cell wall-binding protein n=1 Tax=Antiquaquibacter oligotrophicus TaxID=2880260 RepID=A0ABT6KRJ7_9MICO|nr:cell wall-binding repeat-containing protein [Antiquaquibacter oligotrophicus]MDH6182610.1 putative cell wall-binding protein [Antiquaquibacter oligotrophicus]UDF14425.1 cell wall-binding repeat-containing protein [Antiquaquibacter oligotrophicus]